MTQATLKGGFIGFEHPSGVTFEVPEQQVTIDPGRLLSSPAADRSLDVEDTCVAVTRHLSIDWMADAVGELGTEALARMGDAVLVSVHRDRDGAGFRVVTFTASAETWVLLDVEYPLKPSERESSRVH